MRIERFAELYEEKTDEELLQLAAWANDLVDDALTALRTELARRRIQVPAKSTPGRTHEVRPVPVTVPAGTSVADFLTETLRLYHRHFWLFFRLVVPAVAIGWFAITFGRREAHDIVRNYIRGELITHYPLVLVEIVLANVAGMLGSWTAFAFSFAGICVGVQRISTGSVPSVPECFVLVRERLVAFLRLSTLLFVILAVLEIVSSCLQFGIFEALKRVNIHSYIASWLPFWFAAAVLQDVAVPSWFHWVLTASSILAVSIVEPTMFIGFTLLYLQKRNATPDQPSTSEAQLGRALA